MTVLFWSLGFPPVRRGAYCCGVSVAAGVRLGAGSWLGGAVWVDKGLFTKQLDNSLNKFAIENNYLQHQVWNNFDAGQQLY